MPSYGSSDRRGAVVKLVVLHTAEGARTNVSLAAFFDGNTGASSHAAADAGGLLDMIPRERAAWTLGNGNPVSVNLEMCAYAMMNREQWLSNSTISFYHPEKGRVVFVDNPRQIIRNAAQWARRECDALGIPKRWLEIGDTRPGILDHYTANQTYGWGDHHDVGQGFPRDVFMSDVIGNQTSKYYMGDEDMLIREPGGTVAVVSGGIVSGLDKETTAQANNLNNAAGGAAILNVSNKIFADLVAKSIEQENVPRLLRELIAVVKANQL